MPEDESGWHPPEDALAKARPQPAPQHLHCPGMDAPDPAPTSPHRPTTPPQVRHYRPVLLWPLALAPDERSGHARPWERLGQDGPWREVVDEVAGGTERLDERHYSEFVTFLPYVQRFLYGEGRCRPGADDPGDPGSPMRVFRRRDVVAAQVVTEPGQPAIVLQVEHIDLYFFYDLDLVLLNVEVSTDDITLPQAQDLMYRFGRGCPGGWRPDGQPLHSLHDLKWLDAQGRVLAQSGAADREGYLRFVAQHRAPRIAAHWAFLLAPLVSDHSPAAGALRFRQIEYYRMPTTAYLAVDDPQALSRADFVRLGLVTGTPAATRPCPRGRAPVGLSRRPVGRTPVDLDHDQGAGGGVQDVRPARRMTAPVHAPWAGRGGGVGRPASAACHIAAESFALARVQPTRQPAHGVAPGHHPGPSLAPPGDLST